jgi:transcriptional regulator with XRE-family HTH domain
LKDASAGKLRQESVGEAVRLLREEKGISVRALAAEAGFSPSFISQVENGQASPSINSLQHIVHAMGVTMGEFFQTLEPRESPVTRASERRKITSGWSKGTIQSLTTGGRVAMEAVLVTLEPGGSSGKHPAPRNVEEFAYILDGEVTLSLDGEDVVLSAGDSVTVRAGTACSVRNGGTTPAQLIIVSSRG